MYPEFENSSNVDRRSNISRAYIHVRRHESQFTGYVTTTHWQDRSVYRHFTIGCTITRLIYLGYPDRKFGKTEGNLVDSEMWASAEGNGLSIGIQRIFGRIR